MTDLRADLRADLLADLSPAAPAAPAAAAAEPTALPQPLADVTPAVVLQWTPLRWSRPRVVRATAGTGKGLRVGPFTLELSVRE